MEKMGSGAWHSVSRLGDMLGCREWGWLGGRRPRHVCRSEYQSVSAGTSAHTLQAHSWEPLRIRDDSKGQHFRRLQVLLWEETSAAPHQVPRHLPDALLILVTNAPRLRSLKLWPFRSPCQHSATQRVFVEETPTPPHFQLGHRQLLCGLSFLGIFQAVCQEGTDAIPHLCCLGLKRVGTMAACPGGSGDVLSPKESKWPCSHWPPLQSHVPALPEYLLGFGCY